MAARDQEVWGQHPGFREVRSYGPDGIRGGLQERLVGMWAVRFPFDDEHASELRVIDMMEAIAAIPGSADVKVIGPNVGTVEYGTVAQLRKIQPALLLRRRVTVTWYELHAVGCRAVADCECQSSVYRRVP